MFRELSKREQEIVLLVARGLSNRKIARELDLVEGTVRLYLHNIYKKLGVANRVVLALQVHRRKQRARLKRMKKRRH